MDLNAFFIAFVILALVLIGIWLKSKDPFQVFFSFVFGIYLIAVVNAVVFPIPIEYDMPDFKPSVNLIPFDFGYCDPRILDLCVRQIYENILLTIPFGFGVNFVARIKPKDVLWIALAVGFLFEFTQLVISILFRSPFRVVDINDLILNAVGVLLGYGIFRIFGAMYVRIVDKFNLQPRAIFAYIHDIVRLQNR